MSWQHGTFTKVTSVVPVSDEVETVPTFSGWRTMQNFRTHSSFANSEGQITHRTNLTRVNFGSSAKKTCKPYVIGSPVNVTVGSYSSQQRRVFKRMPLSPPVKTPCIFDPGHDARGDSPETSVFQPVGFFLLFKSIRFTTHYFRDNFSLLTFSYLFQC